ncbi:MAG: amino acid synthesis family protein [Proteobacteria bacterium]|nr:amino acid synthesis family protein [Burkholderiales bacterium]
MSSTGIRKILFVQETSFAEGAERAEHPVRRVAAIAVMFNPLVGHATGDLDTLAELGAALAEALMPDAITLLREPATSYGKAAIVGVAGDLEHAAAMLHPRLGKPLRAAVGGGAAIISSAVKVGATGTAIDIPLAHKDDIWSFDHLDTMTVMVADAPRPDEILVAIAIGSGGRIRARVRRVSG